MSSMKRTLIAAVSTAAIVLSAASTCITAFAEGTDDPTATTAPFTVKDGLFDQTKTATDLGLKTIDGAETVTVFKASDATNHYCNGVVMTEFKGKLYTQWQSSATDEDAADTWVAYSVSDDEGKTWSEPKVLAKDIDDGYCSSGGWYVSGDTLVGYVNVWKDATTPRGGSAYYVESKDGENWSKMKPVLMKDGTAMNGIIEQDPHTMTNGRIIDAAHFQPGLFVSPIYTDDPSGVAGWVKADFTPTPDAKNETSLEMEPSLFVNEDGNIVMTFRDQAGSYLRLASVSTDNGATWSKAVKTNMPDCRAKQSAGNLPDGTAYLVGCSVNNKGRWPLTITLSADGKTFDTAYVLRTYDEFPALMYSGKAKRLGYHYPKSVVIGNYLYISYATNKELVEYTRIPLDKISLRDTDAPVISGIENNGVYTDKVSFTVTDKNLKSVSVNGTEITGTDGTYTLSASDLAQVVTALDTYGNKTEVTVTVKADPKATEAAATSTPSETTEADTSSSNTMSDSPKTGDATNLYQYMGLLLGSIFVMIAAKKVLKNN